MWQLILNSLKPGAKQVAVAEGAVILVIVLFACNQHEQMVVQRVQLETAQVSLLHPKTVEVVRVVKVSGPTRTITKVVELPSGVKETTTEEQTDGTQEDWGTERASSPVAVDAVAPTKSPNQNRILVGVSNRNLSLGRPLSYGLWTGYSLANRVDFLVGLTYDETLNHADGNALVLLRF